LQGNIFGFKFPSAAYCFNLGAKPLVPVNHLPSLSGKADYRKKEACPLAYCIFQVWPSATIIYCPSQGQATVQ